MSYRDVDVIVPAYNAATTISRTLDSLRRQTAFERMHIILVDDGSTDATATTAMGMAEADPNLASRLEIITKPCNGGLAAACRTGLEATKAPWIGRCDADDEMPPDAMSRMLEAGNQADMVCGSISRICGQKHTLLDAYAGNLNNSPIDTPTFSLCNRIYRRTLLLDAPDSIPINVMEGINCWEDLSLTARLMALPGIRIACLKGEPVYRYHLAADNSSLSRADQRYILDQHIKCAVRLTEWFESNCLSGLYRPFLLRLQFIAKVKMLRLPQRADLVGLWKSTFPETNKVIMSRSIMGPSVPFPLRIAFKAVDILPVKVSALIMRLFSR